MSSRDFEIDQEWLADTIEEILDLLKRIVQAVEPQTATQAAAAPYRAALLSREEELALLRRIVAASERTLALQHPTVGITWSSGSETPK